MYKVYSDHNDSAICVTTAAEVRELTGATDAQIKKLCISKVLNINGFDVINYTH